jgi:hypothetical protein
MRDVATHIVRCGLAPALVLAGSLCADWQRTAQDGLVAAAVSYGTMGVTNGYWQGEIADGSDPIIVLAPRAIAASSLKYLRLTMALDHADALQLFFACNGQFCEANSVRVYDVPGGMTPTQLVLDMTQVPAWNGLIDSLRLDVEGGVAGDRVRLFALAADARPPSANTGMHITVSASMRPVRRRAQRMAAHHHTLVVADEQSQGSAVMTYGLDKPAPHYQYILARLLPCLGDAARVRATVEDTPGGVVAAFAQAGVAVRYELLPLLVGRDTPVWDGAALYRISTQPATAITVRVGEGRLHQPGHPMPFLAEPSMREAQDSVTMSNGVALLCSPQHPMSVAVRSTGALRVAGAPGNQHLAVEFPQGAGDILVGFATTTDAALAAMALPATAAYEAVQTFYAGLLGNQVQTPEPVIDAAFRSALYNLEYAWLAPYGWIESIRHWQMMWHMQHAGAMPWLGLADRARQCLQSLTTQQLQNGAAPQLTAAGDTHREIFTGGSSQFYAWQAQQYWDATGNSNDALWLGPALDRVVRQVFEEYDPDNDLLLRWDAQIANQEDFVFTPYNGTSPTIEGIAMMRTARQLALVRGDTTAAQRYADRITAACARLRSELWQRDLGRFVYFKDPLGVARLDGQYHTLILPVIYNLLDPLDSYTSMRHLCDRLLTTNGAVCCGNNFPAHGATSGCQIGAAQQPWGARGLAAVGLRNSAYLPLKAVGEWVMSPTLRGSWPEIASEPIPAYFSPPAGLYVQAVIEALFGLRLRAATQCLDLAPAFPDHWPAAALRVADFAVTYGRTNNMLTYRVASAQPLRRNLRWLLPAGDVTGVLLNGHAVPFVVSAGVHCVTLYVDTPALTSSVFTIALRPWTGTLAHPGSIAQGDTFTVTIAGARITGVDDRGGVLAANAQTTATSVCVRVASELLTPYMQFGRLGQLNFSRRTFFAACETAAGTKFWLPVDLAVLPRYELCQQAPLRLTTSNVVCAVRVRNNTAAWLTNTATLCLARGQWLLPLDVPPRSERVYAMTVPPHIAALLSPGDNTAVLLLPPATRLPFVLNASAAYTQSVQLSNAALARTTPLRLPPALMKSHAEIAGLRDSYGADWTGWQQWAPQVDFPAGTALINVPALPCVTFTNCDNKVIALSWKSGTPLVTLRLRNEMFRKLYLLVQPWLENHDMYTPVARICVRTPARDYVARVLTTPGDLDYGYPAHPILSTCTGPRTDRHGLLPLLSAQDGDWAEGKPPEFPQPGFWADTLCVRTTKGLMNVIELAFEQPVGIATLTIETLGTDAALGIVGITGERLTDFASLQDTPFLPPPGWGDPICILAAHGPNSISNWTFEGNAFGLAAQPDVFDSVTLHSRALNGEQAMGKAISPPFVIPPGYTRLELVCQGTAGMPGMPNPTLHFDVIDAKSGERLVRHHAQGTQRLKAYCVPVGAFAGRTVRLEMVDANNGAACAWLGLRTAILRP